MMRQQIPPRQPGRPVARPAATPRTSQSASRQSSARKFPVKVVAIFVLVLAGGIAAYAFGVFDGMFGPPGPVRDPLLDTFEVRTIPGDADGNGSSFRVGEPGTIPPRQTTGTTSTSTIESEAADDPVGTTPEVDEDELEVESELDVAGEVSVE